MSEILIYLGVGMLVGAVLGRVLSGAGKAPASPEPLPVVAVEAKVRENGKWGYHGRGSDGKVAFISTRHYESREALVSDVQSDFKGGIRVRLA